MAKQQILRTMPLTTTFGGGGRYAGAGIIEDDYSETSGGKDYEKQSVVRLPSDNIAQLDWDEKRKMDRLSRDAMRARQAGVSYGKYIAMKAEEPEIEAEDEIPEGWIKCKFCGRPFKPYDKRMLYCDSICRQKSNAPRNRERRREKYWEEKAKRGAEDGK